MDEVCHSDLTNSIPSPLPATMYLPQWVVAAIAVFNAASDQPTAHKTPSLTDNKDGFIVAFMQVSDGGIYHLSVKPKEGEVLKMYAPPVTLPEDSIPPIPPIPH